jgi:putative flippase GtrA
MKIFRQISWFIVVGCAAAATHWLVAVACVAGLEVVPSLANLIGWSVAVFVSFSGHYFLTFRQQKKSLLPAIGRFLVISASGFAINEIAFVTLLKLTDIPYYLLLAIILLAIAALTFVFSRYWAFRDKS